MAVTKIFHTSEPPHDLIRYVSNPLKTLNSMYVTALGSGTKPPEQAWKETNAYYENKGSNTAWHVIQSFPHGSVTPELAHEIGIQFIDRFAPGHDSLVATHLDKQHIHNHMVFNAVSRLTGFKYNSPAGDLQRMKRMSDEINLAHGLPIIREKKEHALGYFNWKLASLGILTGHDFLTKSVQEALSLSLDRNDFFSLMEQRGFTALHMEGHLYFVPHGKDVKMTAWIHDKPLQNEDIDRIIEHGLSEPPQELTHDDPEPYVPNLPPVSANSLSSLYHHEMEAIRNGKHNDRDFIAYTHYVKELAYLKDNQIDTASELTNRRNGIGNEIEFLLTRRSSIPKKTDTKEERAEISKALRKLRSEAMLLDRITETSERMRKAFIRERQPERAEDRIPV